jgi:hypothetical protein
LYALKVEMPHIVLTGQEKDYLVILPQSYKHVKNVA